MVPPKVLAESSSTTRIPDWLRSAATSFAILRSSSEVPSIPARRRNSDARSEESVIGLGVVTIDTDGDDAVTVGTQVTIIPEVVKSYFRGGVPASVGRVPASGQVPTLSL